MHVRAKSTCCEPLLEFGVTHGFQIISCQDTVGTSHIDRSLVPKTARGRGKLSGETVKSNAGRETGIVRRQV